MPAIDIHHHFAPEGTDNEGRAWSLGSTLEQMDRNGLTAVVGSLPPVDNAAAADTPARARRWNEWAARLCQQHPGRLGWFAALPLRDLDGALAELDYAHGVLQADGFGLPTNDGDIWLSDDRFVPLLAELDRRRAVVFLHPYSTSGCRAVGRAYGGEAISPPWLEFPTNTSRLMLGLLVKGVPRRFPAIRFIVCHGGGTMLPMLGRIAGFDGWDTVGPSTLKRVFPDGIHAEFAKFYFDLAQAYAPELVEALRRVVPDDRLLFGSDFTYFPVAHSLQQLAGLALPEALRAGIAGANAARLFPRLSAGA